MFSIFQGTFAAFILTLSVAHMSAVAATDATDDNVLRIHEWGTFTALQDEAGHALPGINIDDEPVPDFCHRIGYGILNQARVMPAIMMKGIEQRNPDVTLRLETPVLYFHPPARENLPFSVDVDVAFHGGWLTEFYPQATAVAPGIKPGDAHYGSIRSDAVGTLGWHHVEVGTQAAGPQTTENVWLAPRKVKSAAVTVPPQNPAENPKDTSPESEQFLFYRGVAHRAVPLAISHDEANHLLSLRGQSADVLAPGQSARIANLWLVQTRRDGSVAFRALDPVTLTANESTVLESASTAFAETDYSAGNLDALRSRMHEALVGEGLFADEATAMVETWKRAYFQTPGLRVFFLVPRGWTDSVLPLTLSRPAEFTRVMMGRIELIGSEQRQLLKRLSTVQPSSVNWMLKIPATPNAMKFYQGRSDFGDLGVKIPEDYQIYLDLGRFRNALVLAEQRVRPTPSLDAFIKAYGLAPAKAGDGK